MKKKAIIAMSIALLISSSNAFATGSGKKGPPASNYSVAWYEVVINLF